MGSDIRKIGLGEPLGDGETEAKVQPLFMKGTASFPQCGFSGRAIQILKACGVDTKNITTVNVLEDQEIPR